MKKDKLSPKRIEHRGFDVNVTRNFDLELKMVKEYNNDSTSHTKKKAKTK